MQNDKLLPCPFCGGEARISCDTEATRDSQGRLWAFTIVCDSCCATSGLCYSVDMATKSWNTRKPMERIVEQLEEKSNSIPIQYENNYEQGYTNGIDYAIDIVKGGVDNAG